LPDLILKGTDQPAGLALVGDVASSTSTPTRDAPVVVVIGPHAYVVEGLQLRSTVQLVPSKNNHLI